MVGLKKSRVTVIEWLVPPFLRRHYLLRVWQPVDRRHLMGGEVVQRVRVGCGRWTGPVRVLFLCIKDPSSGGDEPT